MFNPSSAATQLLYAGEMYDQYVDQYYLRARYYSPATGRLNRIDPFAGNNRDPQSLHKYLYVHCNPVNGIDPTGLMEFSLGGLLTTALITGLISSIIAGEVVRIKGGTEQQIIDAQWKWFWRGAVAGAFVYGVVWISSAVLVSMYGTGAGLGGLQYAQQYGIQTYSNLREVIKGLGLHAHHIVQQRFAQIIGVKANNMLSVAVSPAEHQAFTNAWRAAIPYGTNYATVTAQQLWMHAQRIYADYPALLDAAKTTLGM